MVLLDFKFKNLISKQETYAKIYCENCFKIFPKLPSESVDLIFADPPYNMSKRKGLGWKYSSHVTMQEGWDIFSKEEYFLFNQKWIKECLRVLKQGGSL